MTLHDLRLKLNGVTRKHHYKPETSDYLSDHAYGLYVEEYFNEMLRLETKRTERTRSPFLLLLLDFQGFHVVAERKEVTKKVCEVLFSCTREIDLKGWHKHGRTIGVIFIEVGSVGNVLLQLQSEILEKLHKNLSVYLDGSRLNKISASWHVFPETFNGFSISDSAGSNGQESLVAAMSRKRFSLSIKRASDIIISLFAIMVFAPTFIIIAAAIKYSSRGPILFKQERVGLLGKRFLFYKFRSMQVENDPAIHQEFMKNFMAPENNKGASNSKSKVYKIKNDPRVTSIGRFIRKTSLDELPQFFNVLKGDMSLVGPRPPIPYECESYDIWHRKRVLLMKPGITGFWQVWGRSSTTFDDMVRMDIKYIKEWSLWLDMKILVRTPIAVLIGKGAY